MLDIIVIKFLKFCHSHIVLFHKYHKFRSSKPYVKKFIVVVKVVLYLNRVFFKTSFAYFSFIYIDRKWKFALIDYLYFFLLLIDKFCFSIIFVCHKLDKTPPSNNITQIGYIKIDYICSY